MDDSATRSGFLSHVELLSYNIMDVKERVSNEDIVEKFVAMRQWCEYLKSLRWYTKVRVVEVDKSSFIIFVVVFWNASMSGSMMTEKWLQVSCVILCANVSVLMNMDDWMLL